MSLIGPRPERKSTIMEAFEGELPHLSERLKVKPWDYWLGQTNGGYKLTSGGEIKT